METADSRVSSCRAQSLDDRAARSSPCWASRLRPSVAVLAFLENAPPSDRLDNARTLG
jgi:hypothetical protein